ncbi:MAG: glycosyltransferase family 2 protein [Octadecabacter sp.]|nr:glycosyltransferase family 2 protein [Octadecabacter sp.]
MAKITVGVPTYNGETYLEESLTALRAQDHDDFKVIVLDNASTDKTADIARDVSVMDTRFAYHRNRETVPATENFRTVWALADSPYFLWRADDDLSEPNYLSALSKVLDAEPDAALAVGKLEKRFPDYSKWFDAPDISHLPLEERAISAVKLTIPYWFYGMWRNDGRLSQVWDAQNAYGWLWAWDHLAMLPTLLEGKVAFTNDTSFTQRLLDHDYYLLAPCDKLKARRRYKELAVAMLAKNSIQSQELQDALEIHIEKRVAKLWSNRRKCALEKLSFGLVARRS